MKNAKKNKNQIKLDNTTNKIDNAYENYIKYFLLSKDKMQFETEEINYLSQFIKTIGDKYSFNEDDVIERLDKLITLMVLEDNIFIKNSNKIFNNFLFFTDEDIKTLKQFYMQIYYLMEAKQNCIKKIILMEQDVFNDKKRQIEDEVTQIISLYLKYEKEFICNSCYEQEIILIPTYKTFVNSIDKTTKQYPTFYYKCINCGYKMKNIAIKIHESNMENNILQHTFNMPNILKKYNN